MLQGVLLEMSLVERRGGEAGLVVGISSRSSSGSTIGIAYVVGLVRVVGLLGFFVGLGRRSWMGTCGVVCAVTCPVGGLTSTLGGGDAGGLLGWRVDGGLLGWLTSWRVRRVVGWLTSWRIGRFLGWLASRSHWVGWVVDHVGCNCWLPQCHHRRHRRRGCETDCCCEFGVGAQAACF